MKFLIGTFFDSGDPVLKSNVRMYSLWYNASWSGCIEYAVEASSGKEARTIARDMRLEREKRLRDAAPHPASAHGGEAFHIEGESKT